MAETPVLAELTLGAVVVADPDTIARGQVGGMPLGITTFGYFRSCEEYTPASLIDRAKRAEDAGFDA